VRANPRSRTSFPKRALERAPDPHFSAAAEFLVGEVSNEIVMIGDGKGGSSTGSIHPSVVVDSLRWFLPG
jgi:hypothetical protein